MSDESKRDSKAITKAEEGDLMGSFRKVKDVNGRLTFAAEKCHLVSPSTNCNGLPEGCSVAFSIIHVDADNETYPVGGKLGLARVALDRIAAAAGISWDANASHRTDDGRDPRYCAWVAVGRTMQLDGLIIQLVGSKEMDLRDGSPQVAGLREQVDNKNKRRKPGDKLASADGQIREMRLHVAQHAETKARLRAIRSLGIRSAYNPEELRKPFVVVRLQWTGQSDDPVLKREFAVMTAKHMLQGRGDLYGREPQPAPAPALPAPSIGQSIYGALPPGPGEHMAEPVGYPPAPPAPPTPRPRTVEAPQPQAKADPVAEESSLTEAERADLEANQRAARERAGFPEPAANAPTPHVMKFGRGKDKPITEASDEELEWYTGAIGKSLLDPEKDKWREQNEAIVRECRAEMALRAGEGDDDGKY
jgi:hypothetical protein